ncbi:MAG: type IV toxin-antitoxin system AbiEi family antitoxin [Alphaproteobacteria bacterium]|nr:type IV toxin-antitoxin system AbiEi family antitoxin [Alphaproteobacteria bacterium]
MNFVKILMNTPNGVVLTSKWLKQQGISKDLLKVYRKNGLIQSIHRGAFIKAGDIPTIEGAIYALRQEGLSVYIGGATALMKYHNTWQYLRKNQKSTLFSIKKEKIPQWFKSFFANDYTYIPTTILNDDGFQQTPQELGFVIPFSTQERAFIELLQTCPENISVQEAYEILETLVTLRPKLLQNLLEQCASIKVKRLFLYLSSIANHEWYKKIDVSKFDLGTSVYKINNHGKYVKEFNIVVDEVK